MVVEYFIKIVIPIVFSAFVAAFGWFAYEIEGAVVAGVSSLVISAIWTCYSWFISTRHILKQNLVARRNAMKAKRATLKVAI
ncbi:MAG: hypothetical protein ACAH12_10205 [Methylophilaceae bacterium]|uniref:hypothetical protein n=1 Tax=Methylovorus sp. MM2 TaxID=1848038 RepID=UPI0007E199CA|nr:hypothetical protein [Methylovorus sp. MM2]OAM52780.1 hypothetical protein A7981_04875 [Methylovorus sp. MM2]